MHTDSVGASHQFDMALEAKSSKQKCGICCIPIAARGVLDCCSDIFCFSCIDTWSAFTSLCPLCKLQFKFITFVPVAEDEDSSDVETQEAFFDFLGQERVESWIDDCEEDGTLSFPSYFIEEDAVVCLDGDGCRVRKGLTEEDGESGLEDTSVACDACDCWYHASCVGYKPDSHGERSWICPRCVGTGVLDLFKFQPPTKNFTSKISSKSMSLDKDGSFTFVDEGETAVVVSMDCSFRSMSDRAVDQASTGMLGILSENRLDELLVKAVEDTEEKCVGAVTGAADSSLKDSGIVASNVSLLHPDKTADVQANDQINVRVDNPSFYANFMKRTSETVSIKPASAGIEEAENFTCEVVLDNSQKLDVKKDESSLLLPSINDAASISSASGAETSCQISGSNDSLSGRIQKIVDGDNVLESMDVGCRSELGVDQETKHSKQEVSPDIQQHSLLRKREPSHRVLEKHKREKKKLKSEDRVLISTNQQSMVLRETLSEDIAGKSAQIQVPDKQSITSELIDKMPTKQELIDPVLDEVKPDQCRDLKSDAVSMKEIFKPKSEVIDELKELVQGLAPCPRRVILPHTNTNTGINGTSEGVRTGKIIYRGSVQHGKTSKIMNEIRQHLKREAVDFGIAGDNRKLDVTDEKFFMAFKAAVQSSQANLSQQLAPVKKMSLQKPGSKRDGSRKSLMKKLYGGTGKRRQAWDRDWDISFWRERVSSEKRARQSSRALLQQEMAHMEEAIQSSKEANKAELDSLRSRVYLADTSLLPRQMDIKPLSEQNSLKTNSLSVRPLVGNANTAQGVSKHSTSSEGSNVALDSNVSLKTDKRKWALEVLARKTGLKEKLPRNQGSLLAELPQHMRPVLEYERRSKVPTATRQVQLDRFLEYYLQKAPIESVNDNSECREAISSAVTKEKEIYDKSNSKGVYVNLCVQTLASLSKVATPTAEEASSLEAGEPSSLLAAELLSPLETVETLQNGDIAVLMALKATGLISDSPPASPLHDGQESSRRNPLDMDKGFEECNGQDGSSRSIPDVENSSHAGDCLSLENLESSCHELTEALREVSCGNGMENTGGEQVSLENPKQEELSTCVDNHLKKNWEDNELHAVTPRRVISEEKFQHKEADCEQHSSLLDTPSQEGTLAITKNITSVRRVAEKKLAQKNADDHEAHCSSIDIPIQEIPSANSQGITTETRVEDALHTSENIERITKQVESYVKDHIRPLRRSHVITTDQYVWAVSKTTNKVMQHHAGAKSADFLIADGEKVRRLAEQYVQLYSEHMFHGMN